MVIATEGRKGGLPATKRNAKEGEIGRDFMLVIEREQANRGPSVRHGPHQCFDFCLVAD